MTTKTNPLAVMYREEDMRRRNARRETARGNAANAVLFMARAQAIEEARAAVAEQNEALKSAREWHLCDKWRFGDDEQRAAWQAQLDRYDAALAAFEVTP